MKIFSSIPSLPDFLVLICSIFEKITSLSYDCLTPCFLTQYKPSYAWITWMGYQQHISRGKNRDAYK